MRSQRQLLSHAVAVAVGSSQFVHINALPNCRYLSSLLPRVTHAVASPRTPRCFAPRRLYSSSPMRQHGDAESRNDDDEDGDDDEFLVCNLIQGSALRVKPQRTVTQNSCSSGNDTTTHVEKSVKDDHLSSSDSAHGVDKTNGALPPPLTPHESLHSDVCKSVVRPVSSPRVATPTRSPVTLSRKVNESVADFCMVRATYLDRPAQGGQVCERLEWRCMRCEMYNFLSRENCRKCGSPSSLSKRQHFPPVRHVNVFPPVWLCTECGCENGAKSDKASSSLPTSSTELRSAQLSKMFCKCCSAPFGGAVNWYCARCAHLNPAAATTCATCLEPRAVSWVCPLCSKRSSIYSLTCFSCHHQRERKVSDSVRCCNRCDTLVDVRWEMCSSCLAPLVDTNGVFQDELTHCLSISDDEEKCSSSMPAVAVGTTSTVPSVPAKPSSRPEEGVIATRQAPPSVPVLERPPAPAPALDNAPHVAGPPEEEVSRGNGEVDNAWWCRRCNVLHRRNMAFCDICLQPRGAVSNLEEHPRSALRPELGDWQCPYCRQHRAVTILECCGHPRPLPLGYWTCPACCSTNRNLRLQCLGCHAARPVQAWECAVCSSPNPRDTFRCAKCGHVSQDRWQCGKCEAINHEGVEACVSCGAGLESRIPRVKKSLLCPVCGVPNLVGRQTCFRCHSRILSRRWKCASCKFAKNKGSDERCLQCHKARRFPSGGEVWVCGVCSMPVSSGGEVPEMHNCPLCTTPRDGTCPSFPARWQCPGCKLHNPVYRAECPECGARRVLPAFKTTIICSSCLNHSAVGPEETCAHCGASLSVAVTNLVSRVTEDVPTEATTAEDADNSETPDMFVPAKS